MDRDLASVLDIVRMGRLTGEFVGPASRTDLDANPQLRLALLHALLIISGNCGFSCVEAARPWTRLTR